jgi:hypothetical protein
MVNISALSVVKSCSDGNIEVFKIKGKFITGKDGLSQYVPFQPRLLLCLFVCLVQRPQHGNGYSPTALPLIPTDGLLTICSHFLWWSLNRKELCNGCCI